MCGHDCRVNAVSPCHIEAGGLIVQLKDKKDPFLNPCLQQVAIFAALRPLWKHMIVFSDTYEILVPRKL